MISVRSELDRIVIQVKIYRGRDPRILFIEGASGLMFTGVMLPAAVKVKLDNDPVRFRLD